MEAKKPMAITYDNVEKFERTGRDLLCWQFYCQDCGHIFGTSNPAYTTAEATMKRLETSPCEECGATNWAYRDIYD